MSTESRFEFPGASFVMSRDTPTHEVDVVKIEGGGHTFLCEMIRRKGLAFEGDFLVASVRDKLGRPLWKFSDEKYNGVGLLAMSEYGVVVALVEKGRAGKVERVIPLRKLADSHHRLDVARSLTMKRTAADFLLRDYVRTGAEAHMVLLLNTRRTEEERAAEEAAKAAREKLRIERVAAIMARAVLVVYTADGRTRKGVPATEQEWPMLDSGTHVVLVSAYGPEGAGEVSHAFVVKKGDGRPPYKEHRVAASLRNPLAKRVEETPKSTRSILVEREGEFLEVALYRSMDAIRAARAAGLNSGALVAVEPDFRATTLEVFEVFAEKVETVGKAIICT